MIAPKPKKPIRFTPALPKLDYSAYRPRRKPVTVAAGFVCEDGVLLCADTKITTSIKTNESKIAEFVSNDRQCALTFVMSSDDLNFPRSAINACFEYLSEASFATSTMEQVRNAAQTPLAEFYRDHIYPHPDRTPQAVFQQLLLGIWLRGETALFRPHETLLMPVETFECIGSGAIIGRYIAGQFKKTGGYPKSLQEAALLASSIIESCIEYDEHCGGEAEMVVMHNDGRIESIENSVLYPGREFLELLQYHDWKMLRALAAQIPTDEEIDSALENHSRDVKAALEERKAILNILREHRR